MSRDIFESKTVLWAWHTDTACWCVCLSVCLSAVDIHAVAVTRTGRQSWQNSVHSPSINTPAPSPTSPTPSLYIINGRYYFRDFDWQLLLWLLFPSPFPLLRSLRRATANLPYNPSSLRSYGSLAGNRRLLTAGTLEATVRPRSIREHRQLFDIPRTHGAALTPITAHPRSCVL